MNNTELTFNLTEKGRVYRCHSEAQEFVEKKEEKRKGKIEWEKPSNRTTRFRTREESLSMGKCYERLKLELIAKFDEEGLLEKYEKKKKFDKI